ncbi:MAG: DUF1810 domain-containing protein [Spirochaetales bacterium]|nr:DUF1810 domain-containing protein [Candidatus Physcosoma equi]
MSLNRFKEAQKGSYASALEEIRSGRKESHWMWYVFPQYKGLGFSSMAKRYEIQSVEEGMEYIQDPLLFSRLKEIASALLENRSSDPVFVMGYPDNLKLQSSMTLFFLLSKDPVFLSVLEKYYGGALCAYTENALRKEGINR